MALQSAGTRHQLLGLLRIALHLHCRKIEDNIGAKGIDVFSALKSGGRLICGSPYMREYK